MKDCNCGTCAETRRYYRYLRNVLIAFFAFGILIVSVVMTLWR